MQAIESLIKSVNLIGESHNEGMSMALEVRNSFRAN